MSDYNTAPLYAGAETGLDALIAGVEKKREEEKRLVQNAKLSQNIFKLNPQLLPPGMTQDKILSLSAPEVISLGTAAVANLHYQTQQQQLKTQQQQLRLSEEQARRLSEGAANDALQPAMLARLGQLQQPGERPPPFGQEGPAEGPDTPGLAFHPALMLAAAETNYRFNPAVLDDVIRQGAGGAQTLISDLEGTDNILVRHGNTAFSVPKSGSRPASTGSTPAERVYLKKHGGLVSQINELTRAASLADKTAAATWATKVQELAALEAEWDAALSGSTTPPPAAPKSRVPSVTRPLGPASGGYVPGKRYGGLTYFGGDPNDRANWE